MNTTIITNGSSPYTITSSQYSATVPTSPSHKERPHDFLPVCYRAPTVLKTIVASTNCGRIWLSVDFTHHSDLSMVTWIKSPFHHSSNRNQCHFALLSHRTGLIHGFLRVNGTNGLLDVPSVSACCPDTQACRIKRCSASLYYTTDLTATFCGNIIMRIRLSLTVSVFQRNITESPKHTCRSIPLHMYSTYAHPKHAD